MIAIMRSQVQAAMDAEVKKLPPGTVVDQAKRQELEDAAVRAGNLVAAGALALGVLFVVFGIIINHFPVPVTVLSLVLYIGAAAVFGILEPTTLAQGLVIKIIVIVALAKAIQSAIAYEKERRASLEVEPVE
jgi:predicted RND superfamily exporter protein